MSADLGKQIFIDLSIGYQEIIVTEPCQIFGVFIGRGSTEITSTLDIVHAKPHLTSVTSVKAILFDQSNFNFTGNLIIKKGAKHTDTYLKAQVLMMSSEAKATAVPSLEIMENDVKGGHGATVGQLDREALFYLTSRGLAHAQAQELLLQGFLREITDKLTDPTHKALAAGHLQQLQLALQLELEHNHG